MRRSMPRWLRERGVSQVLGPEAEEELVALANSQAPNSQRPTPKAR